MKFSFTLVPAMPGGPMLPSAPLMPCEADCNEIRTYKEGGSVTASTKLCEELLTFTVLSWNQTAHLGAWNPLLPFRTWRSW